MNEPDSEAGGRKQPIQLPTEEPASEMPSRPWEQKQEEVCAFLNFKLKS